jgi:AcrR family transcriptional regulator
MTAIMTPAAAAGPRQTAEDRREQVLKAAISEFAELGYQAASTAAIARRAGISQPYIYALFPNKQELFLAVHDRVVSRIRATFEQAARGATDTEDALHRMGQTYPDLIGDRFALLCQLQAYAASGDPEVRRHVSREFRALADHIAQLSGATPHQVAEFLAAGMLANVTTILELQDLCEPLWADADGTQPESAGTA